MPRPLAVTSPVIDEPPPARMTTLLPVLPRPRSEPWPTACWRAYAERVLKEADEDVQFRTLSVLAKVAPGRVLELAAANRFKTEWFADQLRADAAGAILQ